MASLLSGCGRRGSNASHGGPSPDPNPGSAAFQSDALANTTSSGGGVPVYELKIAPRDVDGLERSAFSNQTVPASFSAGGQVFEHVLVRYRGAWARTWPKKPLKIFFPKDKPFEGQHCLNLNSGWRDPALIRECLAYHVFTACGVPAPKTRMVRLNLNGAFRGLYIQVQQPDKAFVKAFDLKGASVYKAVSRSNQSDERDLVVEAAFQRNYEKQTRKQEGYAELERFCHDLAHATNTLEFFNERVDLDKYVNYLAATALVQNWDGFNKNHYLIYDGKNSHKWFPVPWDLDRTFGDHWNGSFRETRLEPWLGIRAHPGVTGWNRLQDRFFSVPALRARFANRLNELLQHEFTEAKLFPVIDELEQEIAIDAALDRQRWPSMSSDRLHDALQQVKEFIEQRREFLLGELPKLLR
jgi:spore coat protein H